ncbi:MAG TPA: hypothetical protein VG711_03020, partial [Phycisphaerales bacterium]|nr:hypothetical protein [Phycisphaerales bacterium]
MLTDIPFIMPRLVHTLVLPVVVGAFNVTAIAQDAETPPPVPQHHLAPPGQRPGGGVHHDRENPDARPDHSNNYAMPSFGDLLQPDFARRDMPTFTTDLKLDDNQQPLVQTLLQDYQDAFADGAKAVQRAFSELRPVVDRNHDRENRDRRAADIDDEMKEIIDEMDSVRDHMSDNPDEKDDDQSRLNQLQKRLTKLKADRAAVYSPDTLTGDQFQAAVNNASQALNAWQSHRSTLRAQFISDIQTVLNDSQKPLWPPLERKLTREKTLSRGVLQGESVNLLSLIDELKLPADTRASIASDLDAYDLSLDSALIQRNQFVDSSRTDLWLAFQSHDLPKAQSIDSRESDLHVSVRTVNDDFAAGIASKLPPE